MKGIEDVTNPFPNLKTILYWNTNKKPIEATKIHNHMTLQVKKLMEY